MTSEVCSDRPVPALICLAFARVTDEILGCLHDEGFDDLRLTHFLQVFRHVSGTGDRPADIARSAGVTPQALAQTLLELESLGYVRRQPDREDRRSQRIFWAARGLRAGQVLEEHYARMETRWGQAVGVDAVATSRALLSAILDEAQGSGS